MNKETDDDLLEALQERPENEGSSVDSTHQNPPRNQELSSFFNRVAEIESAFPFLRISKKD